ncbi:MAG: metalloregulator ArsR/SmtB family transcription factor [Paracoccaceae bacterium]
MTGSDLDNGFGGRSNDVTKAVNFLKALSNEGRLQILCLLLDQDRSVGELAEILGLSQPTVSQQLMRLRSEGWLGSRKVGKTVMNYLLRPDVKPIISALRDAFCSNPQARD